MTILDLSQREWVAAAGGACAGVVLAFLACRGASSCATKSAPAPGVAASSTNVRSTTASGVKPGGGSSVYESSRAVDEYLHFHFSAPRELVPFACAPVEALNFASRCAQVCAKHLERGHVRARALDVGCAVGGATVELGKHFQEAVGIDFSHAFVAAANDLKTNGRRDYTVTLEADIQEQLVAYLPADVDPTRLVFRQGDACNLSSDLGQFDAVLAANLLCRLPQPKAFLSRLSTLVRPGGVAVLVSPYSWLEEYTPKSNWLGGFVSRDDRPQQSSDAIRAAMSTDFVLVAEEDMPFLIREHRRKYQWGCSHCTVWRRKAV